VCGVYVDLQSEYTAGSEFKVTIPIKLNLNQILMLASVRYLPSFAGRWELELYPNWNNIVVMPVSALPSVGLTKFGQITQDKTNYAAVTKSFTQIGLPFTMIESVEYKADGTAVLTNITPTLTCNSGSLEKCLMNMTTFQLRFEVFEELRNMYAEQPLIIPTNLLHYSRFSGQPTKNLPGVTFHATLSQSLENCDSVFIIVPFNNTQTTCFYQPWLDQVRLSLGEFGIHPSNYVQTFNDPRFLAMCLDSLNLETSEITAMNRDVARSITCPRAGFKLTSKAGDIENKWYDDDGDKSDFFIGVTLSQVGFQSGTVSSPNTNIPFIFDANLVADTGGARASVPSMDTSIVCMFLLDCALMIQVVPGSDIPVVKLTNKSIV
jgi:hypothetical protein